MIDREEVPAPGFSTSPWSPEGIATLHAAGGDMRSALEAGLRAVLALAAAPAHTPLDTGRSAPIRGEGDDLGSLFADLIQDLLGQIEFFGGSLQDVAVDGVLRRGDGGYVGWGYGLGALQAVSCGDVPRLLGTPTASESATQGVVLHATLHRP
ncbi:MAG: hypothetical protein K0S14_2479 [Thermomicrobiales bacterium]|jgi:hypothetical protein|nr:hypothetical protein [Thermomicrobiales bacterium]MCD6058859.1 hypothetical protein [Thermomicrobiales bacterium]MDF2760219.1 hypothetical protein [Thermomicrobiales bacterium]